MKTTATTQVTKARLAAATKAFSRDPNAMHWHVLETAMRAHQLAVHGATLTTTTTTDDNGVVVFGLEGELVDHDGCIFPVGESMFNADAMIKSMGYYTANFDNVWVTHKSVHVAV